MKYVVDIDALKKCIELMVEGETIDCDQYCRLDKVLQLIDRFPKDAFSTDSPWLKPGIHPTCDQTLDIKYNEVLNGDDYGNNRENSIKTMCGV